MGLQAAAMKTEKQCCTNPGAWWMFLPWTLTVSDPLLLGSVQTLTQISYPAFYPSFKHA